MFSQNYAYSLFQATCANLYESVEHYGAVAVDKTANKTKFAKTITYSWTVIIFLKKLAVFSEDPWNWWAIFLLA